MSLDKAIEHGKERRKPYHGSKKFDTSCRNHGDCPWCEKGRQFSKLKMNIESEEQLKDIK